MTLGERLINRGLEQGRYEGKLEGMLEGRLEGKLEGMLEGKLEGKLEIAKQLLVEGVELAFIVKITGLSQEQITALEIHDEHYKRKEVPVCLA